MRASTARLIIRRCASRTDVPQVSRLIHRTRLASFTSTTSSPSASATVTVASMATSRPTCRRSACCCSSAKARPSNAASLDTTGRRVITITEALKRMRAEVERGELAYSAAPMEQLAWMYQSCAAPVEMRTRRSGTAGRVLAAFARTRPAASSS